jgi:hypothetical protein
VTSEDDFLITPGDLRPIYCPAGWRWWFPLHGLDLRSFIDNGIMASELAATGDELALRAVAMIRERKSSNG